MNDRRLVLLPDGIKRWLCMGCHVPKEADCFYSAGKRQTHYGLCKECTNRLHRTKYAALHRAANLRYRERERVKRAAERARRVRERSCWKPMVSVAEARQRAKMLADGTSPRTMRDLTDHPSVW